MDRTLLNHSFALSGISGTVYYISQNGNDAANGLSAETAWCSLEQINTFDFQEGDAVLFERGGMWRGTITAKSGVTYASYGIGEMPIINGSSLNYAAPVLWEETSDPHVYRCTLPLKNVGIVAFDHSDRLGIYNELYGTILFHAPADTAFYEARGGRALDQTDLCRDLQFYSDLASETLYLYSEKGNPGERFSDIEIGEQKLLFKVGEDWHGHDITLEGLRFRYTGAHGVSGGGEGCRNITVRNCVFDWIGGSVLTRDALYGNAIEMYGQVQNFVVENNWCYQIFDTGITFQASSRCEHDVRFENIRIEHNLVEYCHWSIEYYNQPYTKTGDVYARSVKHVHIAHNICRFGGMGWGLADRMDWIAPDTAKAASATLLCSWGLPDETEDFLVYNNVFDRCDGFLGLIQYLPGGDREVRFSNNIYIQNKNAQLGKYHDARIDARLFGEKARACTELALDIKMNILADTEGTVLILDGDILGGTPVRFEWVGNDGTCCSGIAEPVGDVQDLKKQFAGGVVTLFA